MMTAAANGVHRCGGPAVEAAEGFPSLNLRSYLATFILQMRKLTCPGPSIHPTDIYEAPTVCQAPSRFWKAAELGCEWSGSRAHSVTLLHPPREVGPVVPTGKLRFAASGA